jgi:hypothetical protein
MLPLLLLIGVANAQYMHSGATQTDSSLVGHMVLVVNNSLFSSIVIVNDSRVLKNSIVHMHKCKDIIVNKTTIIFDSYKITQRALSIYAGDGDNNYVLLNGTTAPSRADIVINSHQITPLKMNGLLDNDPLTGLAFYDRCNGDCSDRIMIFLQLNNKYQVAYYSNNNNTVYVSNPDGTLTTKQGNVIVTGTYKKTYPNKFTIILPEILLDIVCFVQDNEFTDFYAAVVYTEGVFHGEKVLGTGAIKSFFI